MDGRDIARSGPIPRGRRPWHVQTLLVREPGGLTRDREHSGPHREGEEPKPMMHAREKSDSAIVAEKPTNKAEQSAAEPVEPRAETKGNASQQSTCQAQYRNAIYEEDFLGFSYGFRPGRGAHDAMDALVVG